MSYEERLIAELAAQVGHVGIDAAGVAGQMRLRFGTLDALSRQDFRDEIRIAVECERDDPGYLDSLARSYGYRVGQRLDTN